MEVFSGPKMYLCDPKKNAGCRKTNCMYNTNAIMRVCDRTSKQEYAVTDERGQPMEAPPNEETMRSLMRMMLKNFESAGKQRDGPTIDVPSIQNHRERR